MLYKKVQGQKFSLVGALMFVLMVAVMIALPHLSGNAGSEGKLTMSVWGAVMAVILGFIGAGTMIVPGISGSMVMLVLGYYNDIIGHITGLKEVVKGGLSGAAIPWGHVFALAFFAIGAVLGLLLVSRWRAYALTIAHPTLKEEMTFYALPPFGEFPTAVKYLPAFRAASAVYEDQDMLVVDKNPGVEVETDLLSELCAVSSPLFPVHRLDANTVGLVALAKTEAAEEALLDAFARHDTGKVYEAILVGAPEKREGTLVHYGLKDEERAYMRLVPEGTPGALKMELSYRIVEARGGLSKAEIQLVTGRTHQIRVQMAALGCPVLGDDKYGDREANKRYKQKRQLLLAKRLTVGGKTFTSTRELTIHHILKEDL